MTALAEFTRAFEWGIFRIADAVNRDPLPDWPDNTEVLATPRLLIVPVMHAVDGEVTITIRDDLEGRLPRVAFEGFLEVPSGEVLVVDPVGAGVKVRCTPGSVKVVVRTNDGTPSQVHVAVVGARGVDSVQA